MKFAPASGVNYFREHGWAVRAERSYLLEARRLRRGPPFASLLYLAKSLTARGRKWLREVVAYAVVEPQRE